MILTPESKYPCDKCGELFPLAELHEHFQNCTGKPKQTSFIWNPSSPIALSVASSESSTVKQETKPQSRGLHLRRQKETEQIQQVQVDQSIPVHHHKWIESDLYKVCLGCNHISPKLKGLWFIYIRYFFAISWILLFIGFIIGHGI